MHPYPPTLNIPNAQGYYYNNGEIHQHQPDNPGFPMHGGLMVSNEFYSTNTKTPEMMPNLPQEQPSPPMYYTPTNNVPFNNNNPSNCSISTPSSNSNTSSNITTATSPVSSFPSPQTRHNSLTSDTSVSSIQFPEEDKLSPLTRNTKLPKDKREKALERNRQGKYI
jgi:hypothetical protein